MWRMIAPMLVRKAASLRIAMEIASRPPMLRANWKEVRSVVVTRGAACPDYFATLLQILTPSAFLNALYAATLLVKIPLTAVKGIIVTRIPASV
jgi:hypothetical protein